MNSGASDPPRGPGPGKADIGPRLRARRHARGVTLADLSQDTGISITTLSRFETGHRRPNLDQALSLARAHRVSLDELVGSGRGGEPTVGLRLISRRGMTLVRLIDRPGGLQAYKIHVPVIRLEDDMSLNQHQEHDSTAEQPWLQAHAGHNWLCVLSGRLRLLLEGHELILAPGEVAEYDARTPHWYAAAGPGPAEILAVFGAQGESLRQRARTRSRLI
jgi:transcriptional regulator with XRE-family HTH domain